MCIDDKFRVECYMEFYGRCMENFHQRRNWEWKLNVSIWTPIAVLTGFALKGDIVQAYVPARGLLLGIYLIFLVAYAALWSPGLHSANKLDREYAWLYKDAVEKFITGKCDRLEEVTRPRREYLKSLRNWSPVMQILMTGGLLTISLYVFWKVS